MKTKGFKFWKLMVVVLLLCAVGLGFIQSSPGKNLLASVMSDLLSRSENLTVEVGRIRGWIPGKVSVDEVNIGDAQGTWLTIEQLQFRWIMTAILKGDIRLSRLGADQVIWHRLPVYERKEDADAWSSSGTGSVVVQLDDVSIKQFRLEKSVAGTSLQYAVHSGGIVLVDEKLIGKITVSGDAEGVVQLDAHLAGRVDDYLGIRAELNRMLKPTFGLDHLSGNGEATITAGGIDANVTAALTKGTLEGKMKTRLRFARKKLQFQQFEFSSPNYSLAGDMTFGFGKQKIDVALQSAFIDSLTNTYHLSGTATVATSNKTWGIDLHGLDITGWDVVALNVSGKLDPRQVSLKAELQEFGVRDFPFKGVSNYTGKVNGVVTIDGTVRNPTVMAGIQVSRFGSSKDALDELPPLDFTIMGGISEGQLFGSTVITNQNSGRFEAKMDMPCTFALSPFDFSLEPEEVEVHLAGFLDLGIFNRLAMFQDQLIGGTLATKVDYVNRKPAGFLRIGNGRYEHYDWGFLLQDLNAELDAENGGFIIKQATASDGGAGRVLLSGGVGGDGYHLRLDLKTAHIIRREEFDAILSGGLDITGKLGQPDIKGTLTVDHADIMLDSIATAPPAVLTDYDASATNETGTVGTVKRKPPPFGLDVKVQVPENAFVVASMIEAVLKGRLRITDTPKGISLQGKIEPRRGFVNFVGKKFRFTEGGILFNGSVPMEAFFDNLSAEYIRRDVIARLVLSGPVDDPRFRLESSPPLPEDEILSHVLFNRNTSSISPYQAYQIAAAARQLSGGLSGPGFMYQIRQAVGIDSFELQEADAPDEAAKVAAGKYITSGLYVEVNRSLDTQGETGVMAELEVTRHFSVETYTGPKMRPGIGVNWRNDY